MTIRKTIIAAAGVLGLAVQLLDPSSAVAQSCTPAGSQACQNMQTANKAYQITERERQAAQMKQHQQNAGNFVPGILDKQVGNNTYVSPTYSNGQVGGTVTRTFK